MSEIIKMPDVWDRHDSEAIGFEAYMDRYDELIGIAELAKNMFKDMHLAFCMAADEIGIDPDEFVLDQDVVDETYARTLEWMMPPEDIPDEDPVYYLAWEAHKGKYKYIVRVRRNVYFTEKIAPLEWLVTREKKGSRMEYYKHDEKKWVECIEA